MVLRKEEIVYMRRIGRICVAKRKNRYGVFRLFLGHFGNTFITELYRKEETYGKIALR